MTDAIQSDKPKRRYMPPESVHHDTLRRHIKRSLPVPLQREEMTDIAIAASKKRQQIAQLTLDQAAEKKRRQQQIDDLQSDVDTSDRELATGHQDRIVMCNEIFVDGTVHTVRCDTWESFESRAANAQEAQRFLPAVESSSGQGQVTAPSNGAAQAKASAPQTEPDDDAEDAAETDPIEDDGTRSAEELTAAQRAAAEASSAREARRAAKKVGAK
jgi:hypothetical protein